MIQKILLLMFASSLSISCIGGLKEEEGAPSKAEAKQRLENGDTKDYCEILDWYDDGECDSFCIKPDADCVDKCEDAELSCPDTAIEVPKCEGHPDCQELTACGKTIFCETCDLDVDKITWHSVESICPDNHFPLSICDTAEPNRPCIEIESVCGRPIFCNPKPLVQCFSPVCDEGFLEVESCRLDDATCEEVIVCDEPGFCIPDQVCGSAECRDDEIEYMSKEDCELNDGQCRQEYRCNDRIWCGGLDNCLAPSCGEKTSVLECSNLENCSEEFGCGQQVLCED